eukprot:scaffold145457_cov26-Cyclotella_meneghiniana.AAC.1
MEGSVNDAWVTIEASDGSGSMNAHVRLGNVIRYGAKLLVVSFMVSSCNCRYEYCHQSNKTKTPDYFFSRSQFVYLNLCLPLSGFFSSMIQWLLMLQLLEDGHFVCVDGNLSQFCCWQKWPAYPHVIFALYLSRERARGQTHSQRFFDWRWRTATHRDATWDRKKCCCKVGLCIVV